MQEVQVILLKKGFSEEIVFDEDTEKLIEGIITGALGGHIAKTAGCGCIGKCDDNYTLKMILVGIPAYLNPIKGTDTILQAGLVKLFRNKAKTACIAKCKSECEERKGNKKKAKIWNDKYERLMKKIESEAKRHKKKK